MRAKRKPKEWLFATQAGAILDVHYHKVLEVALAAGIRMRGLPGEKNARYNAEDCRRVARESVIGVDAQKIEGTGLVGTIADDREAKEDGPGQILADESGAASATQPTEAGVLAR